MPETLGQVRAIGRGGRERRFSAAVAQLVERVLGKDEVTGPSPVSSFGELKLSESWCVAAILINISRRDMG